MTVLVCAWTLLNLPSARESFGAPSSPKPPPVHRIEVVVAKMKREDTSWYDRYLSQWPANIYVVDDPTAELTVPVNRGRESMVYLT